MNPDELRRRGIGGGSSSGDSTEGAGGAGGSISASRIKPVVNPTYKQFQDYADQARRDQDKLRTQRDALRDPTGMDKDEIKRVNKQVQGAVDAEKRYTDAAQGKGKSTSAIVPTTTTDKKGAKQETPISAYLRTKRGGAIKKAERGGAIVTTGSGSDSRGGSIEKVKEPSLVSQGPVTKAREFVKKNPVAGGVTGLAAYDLGKGILSKIMKLRSPLTVTGGRVGRRSAGGN